MKEKNILYMTLRTICYPFFMLLFHPRIIGKENFLDEGLIICGNHTSPFDIFLIIASTRRKLHFFSKIELFNTKFKNAFFRKLGCIPVNRKEKNKEALLEGYKYLNEEKLVVIFPEGTINRTEEIVMPFKFGAIKMASETKKKILPFAIVGKYNIFGKSVKIIFDKPYNLETSDFEKENQKLRNKVIKLIKEN